VSSLLTLKEVFFSVNPCVPSSLLASSWYFQEGRGTQEAHQTMEDIKLIPPFRFAIVEEGLFRGGYPNVKNFQFLQR